MRFGLVINPTKTAVRHPTERVRRWCQERGVELVERAPIPEKDESPELISLFPGAGVVDDALRQVDALISLGGDGTILSTARLVDFAPVPILGVNLGELGFLAEVGEEHLESALEQIVRGDYHHDERLTLRAEVIQSGHEPRTLRGLNDVFFHRQPISRITRLDMSIDGRYLGTTIGDGLVIATPTGSTAYSLSSGGPVIVPTIDALVLTPIAPHTLNLRPVVFGAEQELTVRLVSDDDVVVAVDDQVGLQLRQGDEVKIRSGRRLTLIRLTPPDFFDVLRRKLLWGYPHSHGTPATQKPTQF